MSKYVELKLDQVRVPDVFLASRPRDEKLDARRQEWQKNGRFNHDMAVTSDGVLVDGYVSLLVLKEMDVKSARFKIRDTATVVRARHPSRPNKLYTWRTNSGAERRFQSGDHIAVRTKYGVREAIVEKVETVPAVPGLSLGVVLGKWDPDFANRYKND